MLTHSLRPALIAGLGWIIPVVGSIGMPSHVMAQAAAGGVPVVLAGELRTRTEWDHPAVGTADLFTYLRTRFSARVDPNSNVRVFLQLQDSRVLGSEGSAAAASADVFDLHQGYLELGAPWRGTHVTVRAGRQEILLGNERLVGVNNWGNTGRSFDGVRVQLVPAGDGQPSATGGATRSAASGTSGGAVQGSESWSLSTFAAMVEERGRRFGTAPTSGPDTHPPDRLMAGAYVTRQFGSNAALDVTGLFDGGAHDRTYDHENRGTIDAHVTARRVMGLRVEAEGAVQAGHQRYVASATAVPLSQSVSAWLAGVRVGTPTTKERLSTVAIGVDALSGDAAPTDGGYHAFGTMFASNHQWYGTMDVIGDPATTTKDRGLIDALATGTWQFARNASLKGELHDFTLSTGTTRPLGWELDLATPMRVTSAAAVDVGVSVFRQGAGAPSVGLGRADAWRSWGYLQLRASF